MRAVSLFCALLSVAAVSVPAAADPFSGGDPAAGKKLFDDAHCNSCHRKIVGGNGNAIFTRPDSIIPDAGALLNRIRFCETQTSTHWTAAEELHVAAFLNQTYYHFP